MVNNKKIRITGIDGEKAAKKFLKDNNYKIIDTNYRTRFGEIDIIAKDENYIVFVEVKARGEKSLGNPMEAVNYDKQRKIIMASKQFLLKDKFLQLQPRFDVIEIFTQSGEINHIINAF